MHIQDEEREKKVPFRITGWLSVYHYISNSMEGDEFIFMVIR